MGLRGLGFGCDTVWAGGHNDRIMDGTSASVALIGPPGVGKTTVGEIAAELLGWEYVDSDDYMSGVIDVSAENRPGENEVDMEPAVLREMAGLEKNRIVTIGGSILVSQENRQFIAGSFDRVFRLVCDPEEAADRRCRQVYGNSDRGLYVGIIIAERTSLGVYDIGYPVDTTGRAPEDIADDIVEQIRAGGFAR